MRGGGGQQQSPNNSADFLWIVAGICIGVALLWYNMHAAILAFLFKVRYVEISVAKFLVESINHLFFFQVASLNSLDMLTEQLSLSDPNVMTFNDFVGFSSKVGVYYLPLIVIVTFAFVVYFLFFHLAGKYSKTFSMKTYRKMGGNFWPYISPVVDGDLGKVDINKGVWAMSLPPFEFMKKYGLSYLAMEENTQVVRVNEGKAYRVFCSQMGGLWAELESLPPYAQCLFAIFAAKGSDGVEEANKLMKQVAASSRAGKLDYSGTRDLLMKYIPDNMAVGRAVGPHAYVLTVMASMLELARTSGVVASSEFLWLKKVDRRMWYMLSSVGRQTPFLEVGGPYAHWLVERRLRRPLKTPVVNEAIKALSFSASLIKYNPEVMGDV